MSTTTYNDFKTIVTKRIKDGSLPKKYKFPSEKDLDIPTVATIYQLVFIPTGLTLAQWHTLLSKKSNGLWYSDKYSEKPFSYTGWRVETIYANSTPLETGIKYTGASQKYELCSVEAYLALQWYNLEMDKPPVDLTTWSWLKNEDSLGLDGLLPVGNWHPGGGRVGLGWNYADYRVDYLGVRPSGRGLALDSRASSGSLSSRLTDYLFNKGHTINKPLVEDLVEFIEEQNNE